MTPKEKAEELIDLYYNKIQHTISNEYLKVIKEIAKVCALIAVDEILETTKVKWATQRKLPNGEWRLWKGVSYRNYWKLVKQEIDKL